MVSTEITDFHAHIYFDANELDRARALGRELEQRFAVPLGHFHVRPVGPHPRGSCQVTVPTVQFGEVATWLSVNRAGLTVFAYPSTSDHRADHQANVVWFGARENLDLSIFA